VSPAEKINTMLAIAWAQGIDSLTAMQLDLGVRTLFAGIGGDAVGATQVPGLHVDHAINHWDKAVQVHAANHPEADHDCADISQIEPRHYKRLPFLWGSPECTWHTRARGRRPEDLATLFDGEKSPAKESADRSRATMWDLIRFAEAHLPDMVFFENVIDVADWPLFMSWLHAWDALGYEFDNRLYGGFRRKGMRRPEWEKLERPLAWCARCGHIGESRKSWKPSARRVAGQPIGEYRDQYVFLCGEISCRAVVEPAFLPALSILDLDDPGELIGQRKRALVPNTRRRIAHGIARHWRTDHELEALHISLMGTSPSHLASSARPVSEPLRTITAGGNNDYLLTPPLMVPYYGSSKSSMPATLPVGTLTTKDRYALVMRNNGTSGNLGWATTRADDVLRTLTTKGHQSVIQPGDVIAADADVDSCYYRMFKPSEVAGGTAIPADYDFTDMTGTETVKGCGNAVTPPVSRDLYAVAAESLGAAG